MRRAQRSRAGAGPRALTAAALVLLLTAAGPAARGELVLPIEFQPVRQVNDTTLFPLYANTTLYGA